ncbi:hypothetical protein [Microbispora sp. CA-102843]|uniref:hypothetical protein n=1 Tax=Microbispora sp. CA-102843 TaxID=3239952 RepID=UPI003D945EA4
MDPISHLSTVHVKSFVTGASGGELVEFAFTKPGTEPASGDWHTAEWEPPTPTGCTARLLIGPDGGFDVGVGTWDMWVKATGLVEKPAFNTGQVPIV